VHVKRYSHLKHSSVMPMPPWTPTQGAQVLPATSPPVEAATTSHLARAEAHTQPHARLPWSSGPASLPPGVPAIPAERPCPEGAAIHQALVRTEAEVSA